MKHIIDRNGTHCIEVHGEKAKHVSVLETAEWKPPIRRADRPRYTGPLDSYVAYTAQSGAVRLHSSQYSGETTSVCFDGAGQLIPIGHKFVTQFVNKNSVWLPEYKCYVSGTRVKFKQDNV